jgi:two-component system phosphate regulon sensor histidine kinase PhoR
MKKIFPLIIVLISLSLLGIIGLQVSWLSNLLLVRQEQFLYKVDKAALSVVQELSRNMQGNMLPQRSQPLRLLPEDLTFSIQPPSLTIRFSRYEIEQKLKEAFEKEGLHDLRFEFAITSNSDDFVIEMQSKNFLQESLDTIHNRREIIPILPDTNTGIEGIIANEHLFIIIPDFKTQVWKSLTWMVVASGMFTLIIISAFYLTVSTMLRQRKLSQIKSDFINNMTHEFKTPIATISLAVDALNNEKVQHSPEKIDYFRNIIKEENKRMNNQVETILQAALMEKQEMQFQLKPLHVHEIIQKVLDNFELRLQEKKGHFDVHLNAKNDLVKADEFHFSNLISNLIDNAIKYAKEKEPPFIIVRTHSTDKHFIMQIQDNGIGMNKDTVKRIFEKFYRAHSGNVHNVKGFGLGMSYVKTVVDEHNGSIKVDSTVGKGSCFTIELPLTVASG